MNIEAHLRNKKSGETVKYNATYSDDDKIEDILFFWTEGNYSCDCNRRIFMGVDYDDAECGDGEIIVDKLFANGTLIAETI